MSVIEGLSVPSSSLNMVRKELF